MNDQLPQNDSFLQRLIEENENLLRSKGKLVQELLMAKKEIETLSATGIEKIQRLTSLVHENRDLVLNANKLILENEQLKLEIAGFKHVKWYQRLFNIRSKNGSGSLSS